MKIIIPYFKNGEELEITCEIVEDIDFVKINDCHINKDDILKLARLCEPKYDIETGGDWGKTRKIFRR